ncbi:MAG TPA: divergent polysaccharide deacetylase family protein [Pseudolabrys sp.]|nr:divergent polysaccharide deacetylase family protein [Pseudolabrys sp.]
METDDLSAPLGQAKKTKSRKLPFAAPQVVAGLLGLCGLVAVGWAALVNDPLGGEPVAVVATGFAPVAGAKDMPKGDGVEHSRHDGIAMKAPPEKAAAAPPGSQTITIIDGSSGKSKDVIIPGKSGALENEAPAGKSSDNAQGKFSAMPAANPATKLASLAALDHKLLENSRHGPIPKVGTNGARALTIYAHARAIPAAQKELPRIAIVIGALGISASGTADAFSMLPAPVTFALAPYSTDVEKLAEHARAENHEVLLQAPMEPFDYPDNDPGPQTLLTSLTGEQNVDRLHWLMSRFQGYVGIESFMGARFTASEQALTPVLGEIAKRGLIFVDGGGSTRSVAAQVAGGHNLPFAKTDIVLDAVPTPIEIDRALARLEISARENGVAVGYANAQPAPVERIAAWAKKVEARGFVLVPITMVALKTKSS